MNRLHIAILCCWAPVAVLLAFGCVTAGAERMALERRRGADFAARIDLESEKERVQTQLAWLASRPAIEDAVARLGLTLSPPQRVAER